MTRYRWNARTKKWEFYCEAWGGWCVLRGSPSDLSEPMTFEEGFRHIASRPAGEVGAIEYAGSRKAVV